MNRKHVSDSGNLWPLPAPYGGPFVLLVARRLGDGRFGNMIMSYKTFILSAAVTAVSTAPAFAQSNGDDEVVVTVSRLLQTQNEIGSSVSIITAEDIETLGFDFAGDAVAAASGVTVNSNGAFGGQSTVRIRGAASGQTLVLIDGVSVNDVTSPGGAFDIGSMDADNIERIEVLKGPQSTLWGADAIGGVVSITTKRPTEGFGASAFAEIGSFDTRRGGVAVQGGNDVIDGRVSVSGIDTDSISKADEAAGNTEDDGYAARTLSARGGVNIGSARLNISASDLQARAETDSFGIVDGPDLAKNEQSVGSIVLNFPLVGGLAENSLYYGYEKSDRNLISVFGPFIANGERTTLRGQSTLDFNDVNKLALGVESEESKALSNFGFDEDRTTNSIFGLYETKPLDGLTLTAGLRSDDIDGYGRETTGRLAAAYAISDDLTLRATWGEGFRPPSLFQLSTVARVGNTVLKPEFAEAFDIGLDYSVETLSLSVSIFDQSVENQINYDDSIFSYFNIEGAETSGLEVDGSYGVTDWLTLSAAYAYIDAEDNTGSRLIGVPEHSGDITFGIDPAGPASGAVLLRYNGEERDVSGADTPDWARIDVNAAYDLTDNVEFYGRVENLFDEDYQQVLGYGTPGASGYVGIRLRY